MAAASDVRLRYISLDGEEGYSGKVQTELVYRSPSPTDYGWNTALSAINPPR